MVYMLNTGTDNYMGGCVILLLPETTACSLVHVSGTSLLAPETGQSVTALGGRKLTDKWVHVQKKIDNCMIVGLMSD